jgi:hypothetical protein
VDNLADIIKAIMEALPAVIKALSDAGVSGQWMGGCIVLAIVGFFWGGKSLKGMKHNVADHLKKLAEH